MKSDVLILDYTLYYNTFHGDIQGVFVFFSGMSYFPRVFSCNETTVRRFRRLLANWRSFRGFAPKPHEGRRPSTPQGALPLDPGRALPCTRKGSVAPLDPINFA